MTESIGKKVAISEVLGGIDQPSAVLQKRVRKLSKKEVENLKKTAPKGSWHPSNKLTNLWNAKLKFFGTNSGYPLTVSSYVINNSTLACGAFTVKVKTERGIENVKVDGLKAGEGVEVAVSYSTDWGGAQTIHAQTTVDPENKIKESNEKDNTQNGNITLTPPYPPPKRGGTVEGV